MQSNEVGLTEILEQQDLIKADACRRSLYYFVQEFWGEIIQETPHFNFHVQFLCEELEKVGKRLFLFEDQNWTTPKPGGREKSPHDFLVNIPPGTTKSTIMSQMFVAWAWANDPTLRFITASYSQKVANEQADYTRQILRSEKYRSFFPNHNIRADADNKENYKLEYFVIDPVTGKRMRKAGGQRLSTSCGGSIMGIHANMIIIDDPLDPKGADGATLLSTIKWVRETIPSRVTSKSTSVLSMVMQRIHEEDPSGLWLKQAETGERKLRHICLPATVSEDIQPPGLLKMYTDGFLDPIRLGPEEVKKQEANLGPYAFAGQYMQTPVPATSGMFQTDKLQIIPIEEFEQIQDDISDSIRYWDKAGSYNTGAYTVGLLMHKLKSKPTKWIVADIVRGQWEAAQREKIIKQTAMKDGVLTKIVIEQEPGSGGKESAQSTIANLAGWVVEADRPTGSKTGDAKAVRAGPFAGQVNVGNIQLLKADWNSCYIDEMRHFPLSKYKDQVDAGSGAFNKLFVSKNVGTWGTGKMYGK